MSKTSLTISALALVLSLGACRAPDQVSSETIYEGAAPGAATASAVTAPVELLDPTTFVSEFGAAEQPYLIDCRTPAEVADGALPNAVNIDFRANDFAERVATLDRDRPVFVYCQSGGRSAQSAELLHALGFRRVVDMAGGYGAYRKTSGGGE